MALPGFLKSKIAAPDILRLFWLWTIIACASFGRTFYEIYRPAERGRDVKDHVIGRDFINVWMGGKLAAAGKVSLLYTVGDYMTEIHKEFSENYPQHNFSYPPHIIVLILIFGLMPYFPALIAWTTAGFLALAAALRKGAKAGVGLILLVLLSPASFANLASGQNGAFTAACFLGGLYLSETAPIPAGILFGLLTVKPHLGILIPFVLLLRKNWKCIASAAVTTFALVGLSLALYGVTPWTDYVANVIPYQEKLMSAGEAFFHRMTPGPFFDLVTIAPDYAHILHGIIALATFAAALLAVKRGGITPLTVLILSVGTLIILPYGFNYDMLAIAGAMAVYCATLEEEFAFVHLLYGFLWALPLAIYEVKRVPEFPFSSIVMIGSFIVLCLKSRAKA